MTTDMTTLAQAIASMKLVTVETVEYGSYEVLQLPDGLQLPNDVASWVYVRDAYAKLFDHVENGRAHRAGPMNRSAIISGNSGIGKSVGALNYFLWKYAGLRKFVVVESKLNNETICFDFRSDDVSQHSAHSYPGGASKRITKELNDIETIYMVDPSDQNSRQPISCEAFCIMFSSPAEKFLQTFSKRGGGIFLALLSIWSDKEMYQFGSALQQSVDDTKTRMKVVGNIPRPVFRGSGAFEIAVSRQNSAIGQLGDGRLSAPIFANVDDWADATHRLFHAIVDHEGERAFAMKEIRWASDDCEKKCMDALMELELKSLAITAFLQEPHLKRVTGCYFEIYALKAIADGSIFPVRPLDAPDTKDDVSLKELVVPKLHVDTYDNVIDKAMKEATICVPKKENEAVVDAITKLPEFDIPVSFQITTQLKGKETIFPANYVKAFNATKEKPMCLFYGVPDYLYPSFNAKYKGSPSKGDMAKVRRYVMKVIRL